jgi:hypothetical protein
MSDKNDVVIINLDRPRELRFGHKALKKLTALTGKSMDNFEIDGNNFEEIEKIMYYGLLYDAKENNETLKLEDMEDLLDLAQSYGEIFNKMQLAFDASFREIEEQEKNSQRVAEKSKKTKKK